MTYRAFHHVEVDAGYGTACHRAQNSRGEDLKLDRDGYAIVPSKVAAVRAHRARWIEAGKTAAAPKVLDHLCRNRWCCNPAHLELVTPAQNVRRGDCTKLDEGEVALMRVLYKEGGFTQKALGEEFGVSQSHTCHILAGRYWSDGPCRHWQMRKEARFV